MLPSTKISLPSRAVLHSLSMKVVLKLCVCMRVVHEGMSCYGLDWILHFGVCQHPTVRYEAVESNRAEMSQTENIHFILQYSTILRGEVG